MKQIALSRDKFALVDDDDYEWLNQWKWHTLNCRNDLLYARRTTLKEHGVRKGVLMHRMILGITDPKIQVDHKNSNGLDNRRSNIRICPSGANPKNARKWITPTSSRFKGVSWHKRDLKWTAQIRIDGELQHLGNFLSEIEARDAYDHAALRLHGEFAKPNEIRRLNE